MLDLNLLKELCCAKGISGDENSVRDIIIKNISEYVDEVNVDSMGNVIAFKKGTNKPKLKLMLSAHMDEVGFIVTHITDDGLIKFTEVGGVDNQVIYGRGVTIGKNEVEGVICVKPLHLLSNSEREKVPCIEDMFIDIGAKTKNQAMQVVNLGDSIYFDSIFEEKNGVIKSKALDDRIGCYVLIDIIKSNIPYDMYFTFVVQEEVGLRGAKTASYAVAPDAAIVVETTTASDIPGVDGEKKVCELNKGAVITFMDKRTIYNKELYNIACRSANNVGAKYQTKTMVVGGNDAGVIQSSRSGVKTIAISLPCRYLHAPVSLATCCDLEDMINTIKETSKNIAGGLS